MSYEYPVWEFEQKFNHTGGVASPQLVKTRGIWKFVADPTAPCWYDETIPNAGKFDIYMDFDAVYGPGNGGWTLINTIYEGNVAGIELPPKNHYFGKAFSLIDYGNDAAPTIVISSATKTFCFRTDGFVIPDPAIGVGDWFSIGLAEEPTELKINGSSFSDDHYIDTEGCFVHGNTKVTIPKLDAYGADPTYSNIITYSTLSANPDSQTRCDMLWDGNYAWAFTTTNSYTGVNSLTVSKIDTWHYDETQSDWTDREKLTFNYYFDNNTHYNTIREKFGSYVTTELGGFNISATKLYDKFYVAVGYTKIYVFDSTGTSCGIITTPDIITSVTPACEGPIEHKERQWIYSNLVATHNALYFSTYQTSSSTQNRLYRYDLTNKTWSYELIPGRHQAEPRHIVDGLDGFIWITNKNNHAVIKVNAATGEIIASVRINRHPYRLMVNQSKELFVASDPGSHYVLRKYYDPELQGGMTSTNLGGMAASTAPVWKPVNTLDVTDGQISVINQGDNSQDAYCAGRVDSDDINTMNHGDFYDDGQGYLWFIAPDALGRLKKSDKEIKLQFNQEDPPLDHSDPKLPPLEVKQPPSFDMIPDNSTIDYDFSNCKASIVTPIHTYQKWDGSQLVDTTVKPYLVWTSDGYTFKAVRLSALVRKSKYKHLATGMVAIGDQAYIGG